MPPKKKGKGKGKKGGKADPPVEYEKPITPEPTEKEILLKEELEKVSGELENAKARVEDLRKENEWLQTEAHKVRVESHEYMSFIEKKTSKRQTTIITLSDHNKQEIRNILLQKQMMEEEFDDKKKGLENLLLDKENMLERTTQELNDLQEYKELQTEQLTKIRDLEKEVKQMRGKHSDDIQQLKSDFLKQKRDFQDDSQNRIHSLETKANKEALQCLTDHTNRIKVENRLLRRELLGLIQKTRVLHEHRAALDEQKRQLLCEQQYANDLKKLRNSRQHKVYKSFRLLDDDQIVEDTELPAIN